MRGDFGNLMPTLTRYLTIIVLFSALVYGAMFALATFVQPTPREMSAPIARERLEQGYRR